MPTGRQTPLSLFTKTPEAYDMKARLTAGDPFGGSGYPLPEDMIPGEPLEMKNQDNNGMSEEQDVRVPLRIGTSKPTGNGVGGPLE